MTSPNHTLCAWPCYFSVVLLLFWVAVQIWSYFTLLLSLCLNISKQRTIFTILTGTLVLCSQSVISLAPMLVESLPHKWLGSGFKVRCFSAAFYVLVVHLFITRLSVCFWLLFAFRPEMSDSRCQIVIKDGRNPSIDLLLGEHNQYVPNHTDLQVCTHTQPISPHSHR